MNRTSAAPLDTAGVRVVLAWGERNRRDLPWRETRDPWAVLVAEVMLQQTQVGRVVERWGPFLTRWPDARALATSPLADVLIAWQGLGYPRRARDLKAAAEVVARDHGGRVPDDLDALLDLPGVGPYTARAVRVFAFEHDDAVLDTNVGRLLARWGGRRLRRGAAQDAADALVPAGSGWAWNQTLLDLAATVCTKRSPRCDVCPVRERCAWALTGWPDDDPAVGSAAVSGRQRPYAGSLREARGRVLARLALGPATRAELEAVVGGSGRAGQAIDGLVDDGLVAAAGDEWVLAGA